ncbi:MAG: hypothetical protein ACKOXP_09900 [Flavobacteriales bacterium]
MKLKLFFICSLLGIFFVLSACHGSKKVQCDSYGQLPAAVHQDLATK